jgi:DNA-binding transcriptional LysR family regulator
MTHPMIDPKSVAAVRTLAQLGSFRAAAEAEATSQASFSRRIARAEAYVGLPLFERRHKGVVLTAAGREFLALLQDLEGAEGQFCAGVARLRDTGGGRLTIGAGPLTTRAIVVPVLNSLLEALPKAHVRILVRANDEPVNALRSGTVDIAICDLTHTANLSDLELHTIQKRTASFWARPQHPIHTHGTVPVADIFRDVLVSPFLHKHWRSTAARLLGGDAEAWRLAERLPQIECDDLALLTDLAAQQDVICPGMEETAAEHEATGLLQKIEIADTLTWNICAARRKGVSFPALDLSWKALIEHFGAEGQDS